MSLCPSTLHIFCPVAIKTSLTKAVSSSIGLKYTLLFDTRKEKRTIFPLLLQPHGERKQEELSAGKTRTGEGYL